MEKIPIDWISTFLYCKRKLFLEEVEKLKEEREEYLIRRKIKDEVYEKINSVDKEIVESIKNFMKLDEVEMLFRKKYYSLVQEGIKEYKFELEKLNIKGTDVFHSLWKDVMEEVELRAKNVYSFFIREKVFSSQLWSNLFPKYLSWIKIENESIFGKVDRVEVFESKCVPILLKNSTGPKEGVWPSDRAKVEVFMVLAEKELGKKIECGYVNYLGSKEIRKVPNNEFVGEFVLGLVDNIRNSLNGKLPDFVKNRNKCEKCPLKEKCYSFGK